MADPVTAYKTTDGRLFEDKEAADKHQNWLRLKDHAVGAYDQVLAKALCRTTYDVMCEVFDLTPKEN